MLQTSREFSMKTNGLIESSKYPNPDEADWPFKVEELSESLGAALSDSATLRETSLALDQLAHDFGCDAIVGASPLGDRLAGAVVASGRNGLALYSRDRAARVVLVVDGLLATGVQIANKSRAILEAGASRVVGAVILGEHEALLICREELGDEVIALEEF
jgi:hypothetical protein